MLEKGYTKQLKLKGYSRKVTWSSTDSKIASVSANGLLKGGFTYKKVQKMQIDPGDIVIKSEDLKNPYTTTYHVEMFTGYVCLGYDSDGNPIVDSVWASRGGGYGAEEGSLLARPTK